MAISPDGRLVFSASRSLQQRCWSLETGQPIRSFKVGTQQLGSWQQQERLSSYPAWQSMALARSLSFQVAFLSLGSVMLQV